MRVLLVNPNRYRHPPVPPLGLECLAASLEAHGHDAEILDLCFAGDVRAAVECAVRSFRPDIAGVTVRNIDTVLYHTNEFFLDEIKDVIGYLKGDHHLPVLVGGSGLPADPGGILEYLGADYAVSGPAEAVIDGILRRIGNGVSPGTVFKGAFRSGVSCRRLRHGIDYKRYFEEGGVAGFETHKGCSSDCVYCLEAKRPVSFKKIEDVIDEIRVLVEAGYDHFHLCDSEFNEDADYATAFCSALREAGLNIRWALYMKPLYASKSFFKLLRDCGVYLVTIAVDSWRKCTLYWEDYEKCVFAAKAHGIRVAVDFLTGFPHETEDEIREYVDILKKPLPDSVGVNTYIRLYRGLKITDIILGDPALRNRLVGQTEPLSLIRPVFYNQIPSEKLSDLIGGDPLFRIDGLERGVNYTRVQR